LQAWDISISQFVPFPVMTIALILLGISSFLQSLRDHSRGLPRSCHSRH
jgi:hypothetical protein